MVDVESAYAALGRKTLELEQMHAEYDRLLALLAGVLTGEIAPQCVRVDLRGRCWALEATPDDMSLTASTPVRPGQVNGYVNTEKA